MKTYLEARREELRKRQNKGFTLMEMLIVVAIIAVLIAIAIPVFTNQLHSSQDATDMANCRSLYADLQADYLANMKEYTSTQTAGTDGAGVSDDGKTLTYADGQTATLNSGSATATYTDGVGWTVSYECGGNNGGTKHSDSWGANAS